MPRIGILNNGSAASRTNSPLFQGLRELGYTEGQNLAIEFRFADWQLDRLPALAAELVALRVDVIVAGATPAARAAKQATRSIPIVAVSMGDPVGDELVPNLGSPGGNVTGNTFLGPELVAKRLQLFKDAVPGFSRLAAIWHPGAYGERTMRGFLNETETTARKLGIELQRVHALHAADPENEQRPGERGNEQRQHRGVETDPAARPRGRQQALLAPGADHRGLELLGACERAAERLSGTFRRPLEGDEVRLDLARGSISHH